MAAAVKTTVTELPESRVRVDAEVAPGEVQKSLERAARALGRDLRMPGFRRGKVPPPVVIQRFGRDTVLDEAVRGTLSQWYMDAIDDAGIHPVGEPDLKLGDLPGQGEPLTFSVEIGVRPVAQLGEYKGLDVVRREPKADDDAVDGELEQLRERSARLETVDEPARERDFVVMDFVGSVEGEEFPGGAARDQLVELGSGRLVPGFEDQLQGARAGEERTVTITFPEDYGAADLAGREAQFAVTVKEVKRKSLPDLDDDFAADAAGFDTLEELREDIAGKLRQADEQRVEAEFREAALDAAVEQSTVRVPDALVEARARELWERMLHQLSHQGITRDLYLQMAGKSEDELLEEAKPDAERALRREAVIAAIVDAEDIQATDGEVLEALQTTALQQGTTPENLRRQLEKSGRLEELRDEIAQRRAVDLVTEHANAITPEQAEVRGKLWTPGKD